MGRTRKVSRIGKRLAKKPSITRENEKKESEKKLDAGIKRLENMPVSMFFKYNKSLGPPYHVIMDTNFINKSISCKLDILPSMVTCLLAICHVYTTKCVIAELEKLGPRCRLALSVARSSPVEILPCTHKGTYADDCLVDYALTHRCYIIATNDKGLKGRLRKIPGVPIMYVGNHKYKIEQLPTDPSAFV